MQPYLDIQNLTKRIGDRTLFENVSFTVGEHDHIALIAKNGTGKSTLLSIIAGHEGHEDGEIVARNGLRIGYLEQSPTYPPELNVMEACFEHGNEMTDLIRDYENVLLSADHSRLENLMSQMDQMEAWDYERQIKQVLTRLRITDYSQSVSQLSGGQLKRIALANILISNPDLLILDEPTNHLDLDMIEWLEHYLRNCHKALLMVTHDRYFLDRICTTIIELDDTTIYTYQGNYSYYLEKRHERINNKRQEIQRANNLYRTELEWMRSTPQARSHKARYREEAFYELEKAARQRIDNSNVRLTTSDTYIGNKIFTAKRVCKSFGDKVILQDFSYTFSRYEKMGIIGNNGTGKTSFVRLLLGEEMPDSGSFDIGTTVRFGYYSQQGMTFKAEDKVIDAVRRIAEYVDLGNGQRLSASQFLQHFLFSPEAQHNYISKLSGGECRRLYLCTVLMRSPNFLILDEPTNDLDIVTLQILEEYLMQFKGCVIIVSHDRYFMDKVVDHLLVFRGDGHIKDFPGNYSQYREWEALQPQDKKKESNSKDGKDSHQSHRHENRKRRLSYKERKELEQLDEDVTNLEAEQAEIERKLSSGTLTSEEITVLSKRLPVVMEQLDVKSTRWLELSSIEDQ